MRIDDEYRYLRILVRSAERYMTTSPERRERDRVIRLARVAAAAAYAESCTRPTHGEWVASLRLAPGEAVRGTTLYARYRTWCACNDVKPLGKLTFYRWLSDEHGFVKSPGVVLAAPC